MSNKKKIPTNSPSEPHKDNPKLHGSFWAGIWGPLGSAVSRLSGPYLFGVTVLLVIVLIILAMSNASTSLLSLVALLVVIAFVLIFAREIAFSAQISQSTDTQKRSQLYNEAEGVGNNPSEPMPREPSTNPTPSSSVDNVAQVVKRLTRAQLSTVISGFAAEQKIHLADFTEGANRYTAFIEDVQQMDKIPELETFLRRNKYMQ